VPTWLYLIRHGLTAWHKEGRLLGQRDLPLDPDGVAQAEAVGRALADQPIAEVVASPLLRAVQTAEVVGKGRGIEVARDARLTDLALGPWEGRPAAEVTTTADWRRVMAVPEHRAPGGESLRELAIRARGAIDQILDDNPAGASIAVVTHGAVVRSLVLHYLEAPLESYAQLAVAPGSITAIAFAGAGATVATVGWTPDFRRVTHA